MTFPTTTAPSGQRGCFALPAPRTRRTPAPRLAARAATAVLWAIGSAYLVRAELALPSPDPVVMYSAPVVWAVIISLPILATYARRDREWIAAAMLWVAALAGSAYTLQATLTRHATSRDTAVASATDVERQRHAVQADLATSRRNLDDAIKRCGTGNTCAASTRELIGIYDRQVKSHTAKLGTLHVPAAKAGERRIAWLLALATGHDEAAMSDLVGMLLPALFGLVLELSAFACAMYGFDSHRTEAPEHAAPARLSDAQSDFPQLEPSDAAAVAAFLAPDDPTIKKPSGRRTFRPDLPDPLLNGPSSRSGLARLRPGESRSGLARLRPNQETRQDEALAAILTDLALGRSAGSQRELCERFGVPRSTMSDWLSEWERDGLIPPRRTIGRCKSLSL